MVETGVKVLLPRKVIWERIKNKGKCSAEGEKEGFLIGSETFFYFITN